MGRGTQNMKKSPFPPLTGGREGRGAIIGIVGVPFKRVFYFQGKDSPHKEIVIIPTDVSVKNLFRLGN